MYAISKTMLTELHFLPIGEKYKKNQTKNKQKHETRKKKAQNKKKNKK